MTDWRTIVGNSETLAAADLDGHAVTVEIESVKGGVFEEDEDTGAKKLDKKAMIAFVGKHKKLAANTINCLLIEAMWGKDYEQWIGHRLTIAPDKVEVKGKFYGDPCVRVHGSPELKVPLKVTIRLPRRKPFDRKLIPTKMGASEPVFDEETGELPVAETTPDERWGETMPGFES